ncbi:nitrate reductase, partial [Burkholderia multivorans]|uniref:solute carrier family 23 protein n=1 Tax=Burkholderia multivorans TaxID=87883 RepID=UPI000DB75206
FLIRANPWDTPAIFTWLSGSTYGRVWADVAPVVLVLVAENIGHVKSVAAMTGRDLDGLTGRALFADGLATTIAGAGGGSGTTTYAENIGVMAATKIYSTAAYLCAA